MPRVRKISKFRGQQIPEIPGKFREIPGTVYLFLFLTRAAGEQAPKPVKELAICRQHICSDTIKEGQTPFLVRSVFIRALS